MPRHYNAASGFFAGRNSGKKRGTAMADESHVIRGIDWKSTFPFTQIFRSFRIAIHPSKIILALLTLLLIWFGGWFLDWIWPANHSAVPGELPLYAASYMNAQPKSSFRALRQEEWDQ